MMPNSVYLSFLPQHLPKLYDLCNDSCIVAASPKNAAASFAFCVMKACDIWLAVCSGRCILIALCMVRFCNTCVCIYMQAFKNQSHAAYLHSTASSPVERHQRFAEREGISQLLQEWVADMKAAGLKHISPSLTALVQVGLATVLGLSVCVSLDCNEARQFSSFCIHGD